MKARVISVVLCAGAGAFWYGCHRQHVQKPGAPVAVEPAAPALRLGPLDPNAALATESIGDPVRGSRTWATALAPNSRGGWNFITQSYEYKSNDPTEFVVLDLDTGKYQTFEGPPRDYSNQNYKVENELRAQNGRIFFPELETEMAYYDPADETVKQLGKMIDPPEGNKTIYRVAFGPNGKMYGSTLSTDLPAVFELDPDTLKHRVIGKVGKTRYTYSYGYFLAVDPPWVYVAVGEKPWELAAIRIDTGESRILATRTDEPFMHLKVERDGITAKLVSGFRTAKQREDMVWCADGKTFPFEPARRARKPFAPRVVAPVRGMLSNPPELDLSSLAPDSNGVGHVYWRPRSSNGPWTDRTFRVKYTSPVDLESLIALPDGTLLGNAKQYHGFFRYNPTTKAVEAYGTHGPSRGPRVFVDGLVYITGYPNGVLYAYDPTKPWTATSTDDKATASSASVNPVQLGYFTQAGAHYAESLVPSKNGRLYFAGRRERDGIGSGVGFYDIKAKQFGGHHDQLSFFDPRGLAVLDDLHLVVFSGRLHDDPSLPGQTPPEAALILYDADLHETGRATVKPGLTDTGILFPAVERDAVLGLIRPDLGKGRAARPRRGKDAGDTPDQRDDDDDDGPAAEPSEVRAVYRYDVKTRALLAWKDLDGEIGAYTQRPDDHSLWIMLDQRLVRIDPETLELTPIGLLAGQITRMVWQGNDLYVTAGSELRKVTLPITQ